MPRSLVSIGAWHEGLEIFLEWRFRPMAASTPCLKVQGLSKKIPRTSCYVPVLVMHLFSRWRQIFTWPFRTWRHVAIASVSGAVIWPVGLHAFPYGALGHLICNVELTRNAVVTRDCNVNNRRLLLIPHAAIAFWIYQSLTFLKCKCRLLYILRPLWN